MLLRIFSKFLSIVSFILFAFSANATNYYLSNSGNDTNSGTSPSAAWQTVNKLNSFKNLKPGDSVLFKRGDTFYGSITINNSGTSGNPITYSAYGIGEKPIITGFTNVTDWTYLGNNIWESTKAVSTLSTCNMVVVNGVNTAMGRWPNSGYLIFQNHIGKTSITSNSLTGTSNWTGAEVVIRSTQWTLERNAITSQSQSTLNYSPLNYEPANGYGFFIQNDLRTLDQQNEWYYNPSTHKMRIFSTAQPTDVKVASIDNLIVAHSSYVIIDNLNVTGASSCGFFNNWDRMSYITIQNCNISFSGVDAIQFAGMANATISNDSISNSNNNGINLYYSNPSVKITNNWIRNIGVLPGMGGSGVGTYTAIISFDKDALIERNKIINAGYIGIFCTGDSFTIKNNFVDTFCTVLQDGGGIYTHSQQGINYGRKIIGNIVLNGIGIVSGTNDSTYFAANGIYLDDNSAYIEVSGNSVANCSNNGLFIHNGYKLSIHDNTFYNCSAQFATQNDPNQYTLRGSAFDNNIFFSKTKRQLCGYFVSTGNDFSLWGTAGNNYYARPIADSLVFNTRINWGNANLLTLEGWKAYSGLDENSKKSPKEITDTRDLRFEVNADSIGKTIPLPYSYIDITGRAFNGSITLKPFTSAILIKNGPVATQSPNADAGIDEIIFLPQNAITLSGSARGANAEMVDYNWTKIAGPFSYNISHSKSQITDVTELTSGVYLFQLEVTDNNGSVSRDTVQITVNPAPNNPPTANAGTDKSITLPTNEITLSGTGTDEDGIISIYKWIKKSGPASYNILNPTSAITDVSALTEGIYQFQLIVTDNEGATATSTVQITVYAAPAVPPVADAGVNKAITLPVNSVSLTGSITETDAPISTILWTKISGPAAYSSTNSSSAITTVSGLIQGIYQFELLVTDVKGLQAKDTVSILVNPAPNIPPAANAGANQIITLPTNIATLRGNGTDSDGTIAAYLWTQISGANTATITDPASPSTSVKGLIQGKYVFKLTVTDNHGATGVDSIFVTVNATPNIPPTANAGTDKIITLPTNSVSLSGSGMDSDGSISSYSWAKISGPSAYNISNASSAITTVSALVQGVYLFELEVTDDKGAIARDTVQVTVNPAANIAPTANAGVDKSITLPTNSISLSGSGTDTDGTISSYSWTKISGPTAYNISSSSSAATLVLGLVEGLYLFELKVTDDKGAIGRDMVQITVNAAPNIPPIANAGADQTITLPVNTININGSGTDADGTIVSYLWSKIAGPAGATIADSLAASTTAKGLIQGHYVFQLTVTDNDGAKATDTMNVTVNSIKNIAPKANAGGDLTILLPVNTVYLNGSGNDADGTITAYQWKQIAGPDSSLIVTENKVSTVVKNLVAGTYEFELTVTDNNGETGKDTVTVVVALGRSSWEPNSIKIYPNPVQDIATIEITSENVNSLITLIVSDFSGKAVYQKQFSVSDYKTTEKINMSLFSKGSYTVLVFFDGKDRHVLKIIKQ